MKIFSKLAIFLKRQYKMLTFNETLTLVISCVALLGAGTTSYWTFLKDKSVLHLVYVDKFALGMEPRFAIVNGGKSDILITSLSCSFQYMDNTKSTFTPSQTLEWKESDSSLLPSGKAFCYEVGFNEKFTSTFVQKGRLETVHKNQLHMHDMYVDISWVEMDGRSFSKSVKLIIYGFDDEGKIKHLFPIRLRKPIDLYKVKS